MRQVRAGSATTRHIITLLTLPQPPNIRRRSTLATAATSFTLLISYADDIPLHTHWSPLRRHYIVVIYHVNSHYDTAAAADIARHGTPPPPYADILMLILRCRHFATPGMYWPYIT